MRRFHWVPAVPSLIAHGADRMAAGRKGEIVSLDPAWTVDGVESYIDYHVRAVPGEGGKPCLVPVDAPSAAPAPKAKGAKPKPTDAAEPTRGDDAAPGTKAEG